MISSMCRAARHRWKTALVLIVCLLIQQLSMSALACTMPQIPATPVGMSQECAEMMSTQQPHPSTALCEKHCAPDATSASTPSIPVLPALALPPVMHALPLSQGPPPSELWSDALYARSDPPPRLRYCRLLI